MISKLFYYLLKVVSRVISSDKLQTKIDSLGYALSIKKYTRQGAQIGENTLIIDTKLSLSKGDRFISVKIALLLSYALGHDASPIVFKGTGGSQR